MGRRKIALSLEELEKIREGLDKKVPDWKNYSSVAWFIELGDTLLVEISEKDEEEGNFRFTLTAEDLMDILKVIYPLRPLHVQKDNKDRYQFWIHGEQSSSVKDTLLGAVYDKALQILI